MRKTALLLLVLGLAVPPADARRFYDDDPLLSEPPPMDTVQPRYRGSNDIMEFIYDRFTTRGERHPEVGVIPAQGVNTLDEVMDSPWFVNRHSRQRLSQEELRRGPGDRKPPSLASPLEVLTVKRQGFRPGLLVGDQAGQMYLLRFDPRGHAELATGASMVSSRLMHAMGYWVPENYLVEITREQLVAAAEGTDIDSMGEKRPLLEEDIDTFLDNAPRDRQKRYRAVATRVPDHVLLLGAMHFHGVRSDDPNDIYPHEHRRELRGLQVIAAWLNNNTMQASNSVDVLQEQDGVRYIKHYLVDFFDTLGSGDAGPKRAREGWEPLFDTKASLKNLGGLGIWTPGWMRAKYPGIPSVGRFECEVFDPEKWMPDGPLPPFENMLPDDAYWAAKLVMAFSDEDIRTVVEIGEYTDPAAAEWIADCLMERRDKIGRTWYSRLPALEDFAVEGGRLTFTDLEVQDGFAGERQYRYEWFSFDNESEATTRLGASSKTPEVPPVVLAASAGRYFAVKVGIEGQDPEAWVKVFLRRTPGGLHVAGLERHWPGKLPPAEPSLDARVPSNWDDLEPWQQELLTKYSLEWNEQTGKTYTPVEFHESLTVSERTTFEAVTNALAESELTDESGQSLGKAIDLVEGIDRIAGQYFGRRGDEQFRIYVRLRPDTRDVLERSQEFNLGKLNTVYHVGYPYSYRQIGKVPNMQFSVSEDGTKADIDVDYRSSKLPNAMFNGHLTAANSDVRAGDNFDKHTGRWSGLINWWRELFGEIEAPSEGSLDPLASEAPEEATPLPADRPRGARIENVHDAAQEFFTDWLVRRELDDAVAFLSSRALACINKDDDKQTERLTEQEVRDELKELLNEGMDQLGELENLDQIMEPVLPWRPVFRPVDHPYSKLFALVEVPDYEAEVFMCDREPPRDLAAEAAKAQYGNYYATVQQFEVERNFGGVLTILWAREDDTWRIVSYDEVEP